MYDTIEDMREDKAVYRAVRAAIVAAHQEDGVTVADIVGETEEQKQAGRIKYLVVAEERGICIQQTRHNVVTRRDRRDVNTGHDPDPNRNPDPSARPHPYSEPNPNPNPDPQPDPHPDGRRHVDRGLLKTQALERMARVRAAATAAGLNIGTRLRRIVGDNIFHKWRWGRVPMARGGWLVTYRHDLGSSAALEIEDSGVEVRLAVMQSQFGWGAYAVCECRSGERLGWYDGEEITAAQREMLGHMRRAESTLYE